MSREFPVTIPMRSVRPAERGIALVFALLVLLVLTLLGVSALRTSALEQLMSGSAQEMTRAFQAAESGLGKSLDDMPADPNNFTTGTLAYTGATATTTMPVFMQVGPPQRSAKPTGYGTAQSAYYDQLVTGATTTNARSPLHQGITLGAPAPQSVNSP
jgi:Tfp pilus assembly protein PilX